MRSIRARSVVNGLIFTALLAQAVWLIGHVLFGWGAKTYPPTPQSLVFEAPVRPSGADVLLRLSALAASQSPPPWPADAPYAYVKVSSWRLSAHATRVAPRTSAVWHTRSEVPVLGDARSVDARLLAAGSRGGGWAPGWAFADLVTLARNRPIPGDAEAVFLRVLAAIPGVDNDGTTTDRAGRDGVAVSLDSSYSGEPITYTLIFNPRTGALREADETLAASPHRLDALAGSVVAYTTFLSSGYVSSPTATAGATSP